MLTLRTFAVVIALLGAVAGDAAAQTGKRYAFLVGCSDYPFEPRLTKLPFPRAEMTAFRDTLVKSGYPKDQIDLLVGNESVPNKEEILHRFRLLVNLLTPDDSVIVAFSGHGVRFAGDNESHFCPRDAKLDQKASLLSMNLLFESLEKCRARQKLLIVQACQNNPFAQVEMAAQRFQLVEQKHDVPEGIAAIFSCSPGQVSYYDPDKGRGLFFDQVIRTLEGQHLGENQKTLDLEAFFSQVKTNTQLAAKNRFNQPQDPVVVRKYSGEWTLAKLDRPRVETPPPPPRELAPLFQNDVGMKFSLISEGSFAMGSPKSEEGREDNETLHDVRISKKFYLGQFLVTQHEYFKVTNKQIPPPGKERLPVVRVSWDEAKEFCRLLSQRDGRTYRLPTEAEWEYACRAGTKSAYSFGDKLFPKLANIAGGDERASNVDKFQPNPWQLYDMHGNVRQWCEDWYDEDYYAKSPATDPPGPATGTSRVIRGGCFVCGPSACRSASRRSLEPIEKSAEVGFRVVLVP